MNIVLIGFCASGKSATAYELAKRLGWKFVDLDKEIEVRYFLSHGRERHYRQIIIEEGPELFFELEHVVLREMSALSECVIAPGGGAPLREENRELLHKLGTLVYLNTAPEVAIKRMQAKGLPLFLRDDPSPENLERIWGERRRIYAAMTDCVIDNSHLSITETADAVMARLGLTADSGRE